MSNATHLSRILKQLSQRENQLLADKLKTEAFALVGLLHEQAKDEKIDDVKMAQQTETFQYALEEAKLAEPRLIQLLPQDTNLAAINIVESLVTK